MSSFQFILMFFFSGTFYIGLFASIFKKHINLFTLLCYFYQVSSELCYINDMKREVFSFILGSGIVSIENKLFVPILFVPKLLKKFQYKTIRVRFFLELIFYQLFWLHPQSFFYILR